MAWATNFTVSQVEASRPDMNSSVSEIRSRLLFLLVRAFGIVVFLSFLFFTIAIGYFLISPSSPVLSDVVKTLEAYYLAKGSWEGVDEVFVSSNRFESRNNALLVDND